MRIGYLVALVVALVPVAASGQLNSRPLLTSSSDVDRARQQANSQARSQSGIHENQPASDQVILASGFISGAPHNEYLPDPSATVINPVGPILPVDHHGRPGIAPCNGNCAVGGNCLPCNLKGFWWETPSDDVQADSRVIRQIELHPNGRYNEILFHRSGVRIDVTIGSYLLQHGELTLLVEGLPQAEDRSRTIHVGGQDVTVTYRVGSSGPFVNSFGQQCSQLVLTDANGGSRVWTRYPPPNFGLPAGDRGFYAQGRPGAYANPFPWLPNGDDSEITGVAHRNTVARGGSRVTSVPVMSPDPEGPEVPAPSKSSQPGGFEAPGDEEHTPIASKESQPANEADRVCSTGYPQQEMMPSATHEYSQGTQAGCCGCECGQSHYEQSDLASFIHDGLGGCNCSHTGCQETAMEICPCGCNSVSYVGTPTSEVGCLCDQCSMSMRCNHGSCTNSGSGLHACTCTCTCNATPLCEASCDCDRCLFDTSGGFTRRFEGVVEAMLARTDTEFTGADHQTLVRTKLTRWFTRKPGLAVTGDYLTDTNNLDSFGVGLRSNCARSTRGWNDVLLGYRFIRREDSGDPNVPDSRTTTEFNGGELGFVYQNRRRLLSCELLAKTALGANSYQDGSSRFAVVPEFGAQLGLQLTRCIAMTAGYTLIYWSDSASEVINPAPLEREFGYGMLQSLNLGLKASF